MKKILSSLFLFLLTFGLINVPLSASAASQFDYRIFDKSPDAAIKAGESIILWVKIQNTGWEQWELENSAHPIRLGTTDPQDRRSSFRYAEKWVSDNRIRATERNGDIYDFGFHIQAPADMATGTYRECFYPVLENQTWITKDPICWNVYVTGNSNYANYRAEGSDNLSVTLNQGDTKQIEFTAKNTGTATWYQGGSYPVHLATTSPRDRSSEFYYNNWLSFNRPAGLVENSVPPGATGHFQFTIKAPTRASYETYQESFWLVAENRQWFPDNTSLLNLKVTIGDYDNRNDDQDENKDFSEKYSSIDTSQESIEADGNDEAAIEIELRDKNDDPIKNVWMNLVVREIDIYDRDETFYQYTIRTDSNGRAKYDFSTDNEADYQFSYAYNNTESDESVMVEAYDPDGDRNKDFSDEYSDITINKDYIEPDRNEEARIDITLRDHDNQVISNQSVKLIVLEREIDKSSWKQSSYNLTTSSSGRAYKNFTTGREADYYFTFEYNGDRARHWVSLQSYDEENAGDNNNNDFEPDNSYIKVNRTNFKVGTYALIEIGVHDTDDDPMTNERVIIFGERCDADGRNCRDIDDVTAYTDDSGVAEYKYYYSNEAEFKLTYEVDDERSGQYVTFSFYDENNDNTDYDVNNSYDVSVLSLSYIPTNRYDDVDTGLMTGWDNENLDELRDYIDDSNRDLIYYLEKGSAYHGYKDSGADRALDFTIVDDREFLDELPESSERNDDGNRLIDYDQILTDDVDVCDYVDGDGVSEIWLWAYEPRSDEPARWESNMMMGYNVEDEWNYSSYGNVSNSEQQDDMPICDNTYTVYTYYYDQDLGEAVASHTRQVEAVLNFVDDRDDTPKSNWDDLLFWGKFVGSDSSNNIVRPGCGSTDYTPNNQGKLDYDNAREISSDCQNWEPAGGTKEYISCKTWGGSNCTQYNEDGDNVAYLVWWMQNLPGIDNEVYDDDYKVKNWWDFVGNFDDALQDKSLTY